MNIPQAQRDSRESYVFAIVGRCDEPDNVLLCPFKLDTRKKRLEIPTGVEAEASKDSIHDTINLARKDEAITTALPEQGFVNCDPGGVRSHDDWCL